MWILNLENNCSKANNLPYFLLTCLCFLMAWCFGLSVYYWRRYEPSEPHAKAICADFSLKGPFEKVSSLFLTTTCFQQSVSSFNIILYCRILLVHISGLSVVFSGDMPFISNPAQLLICYQSLFSPGWKKKWREELIDKEMHCSCHKDGIKLQRMKSYMHYCANCMCIYTLLRRKRHSLHLKRQYWS